MEFLELIIRCAFKGLDLALRAGRGEKVLQPTGLSPARLYTQVSVGGVSRSACCGRRELVEEYVCMLLSLSPHVTHTHFP